MSLKVNIKMENFVGKGNGVYSAFITDIQALKNYTSLNINTCPDDEADLLHYHSIGFGYLRAAMLYRQKIIVTAHVVPDSFNGSLIFSRYWQNSAKEYLRFAYQQAKLVIAVSPQVKIDLQNIGVTRPIEILPNSVDRGEFSFNPVLRAEFRRRLGISPQKFVVVGAGQIQPRKGIIDFVETARKLPHISFVWAGGRPYGKLTADFYQMNQLIETAPKNVNFIGQLDIHEMPGLYSAADVYFLPSYHENFAFATIEAAAVKLPLVLRDIEAYKSSLFNNYLAGKSVHEYVQIISRLSKDRNLYEHYQRLSADLADRYDIAARCQKLSELYREIAASAKVSRKKRRTSVG